MRRARRKQEAARVPAIKNPDLAIDADLAVKGFFDDEDWMAKVGVGHMVNTGAFFLALGVITMPLALAAMGYSQGYQLRLMRARLKQLDCRLPGWEDWLELLISGLTWLACQFCFCVVLAGIATAAYQLWSAVVDSGRVALFPATISAVLFIVFSMILMHFLATFLMVNFAQEEKLAAAFNFKKVIKKARANPLAFFCAWSLASALQLAALILPALTVIGLLVAPSTLFAAQLMSTSLVAQAWQLD
jgi:hypothetical protein